MILKIRTQNFRKLADQTVEFGPGINAIRAPNEAGKTTLLESIAYAFFGTKALKESLDQVVTYDVPVSKLKVDLDFRNAGVDYHISRGKSGAEMTWAGGTVTGQTEVTKAVEKLLGATHDMAAKLMLAKQKALGGALAGGATAAGKLIEDLADLGLIDELISGIAEKLPAGNTSGQASMVDTLRSQACEPDLQHTQPLQDAFDAALATNKAAVLRHNECRTKLDDLDISQAYSILADEKRLRAAVTQQTAEMTFCAQELAGEPPVAPHQRALDEARAAVETEKQYGRIAALHTRLAALNTTVQWDKTCEELATEINTVVEQLDTDREELAGHKEQIAEATRQDARAASEHKLALMGLHGQLIKETTCALCQKDLSDVPEVVQINSTVQSALAEVEAIEAERLMAASHSNVDLQRRHDLCKTKVDAGAAYLKDLKAVEAANDKFEVVYAAASEFITLDRSVVPAQWAWTGPAISSERPAAAGILSALELQDRLASSAAATRAQTEARLAIAEAGRVVNLQLLSALEVTEASDTLVQERVLKLEQEALWNVCVTDQILLNQAQLDLDKAVAANQIRVDQQIAALASLDAAEKTLAEMEANNVLVKKLRAARPIITDKLWGVVLAAVSTYFSEVRGERSVLTRADGEFKVNGRSVEGLSGSAEDVLGLAIRFALTKTFLGNVNFIILDEVAAACDDERELALLGLLAKSGFEQTILVTHSALCESVSDHIITF